MSQADRQRWDEKWAATDVLYAANKLLTDHEALFDDTTAGGRRALDLACGRGQNAIWLARHGYRVLGVDISWIALAAARKIAAAQALVDCTWFVQVDLDNWLPPTDRFDLICVFRFLNRRLFPSLRQGLRVGGMVAYSTRHTGLCLREPTANRAYLLRPGELATLFADWQILYHQVGEVDEAIIARPL